MASKRSILRKVKLGMMEMPSWLPNIFPKEFESAEKTEPEPTESELADLSQQLIYEEALKTVEEENTKVVTKPQKSETKVEAPTKVKVTPKRKASTRKKDTKVE